MTPVYVDRNIRLWRCDLMKGTFPARRGGAAKPRSEMPGIDGLYSSSAQLKASIQTEQARR